MKCPQCQFENQDDGKFCNECGVRLEAGCADCGTPNLPDRRFCKECGSDLTKPSVSTAIDYSQPRSYTPKYLADKILTTRSSIEGERKVVTVLFADVANYTSFAENLDPEEVHQIMDGCFRILMDEIHWYEGTTNQFTGDGVMALFGAPVAHEDHAQRACHAALSIQKVLEDYGERIKRQHGAVFRLRVGLNSGPVIVGSIGNDLRMDYTAVGDTTNLAHRMQERANPGSVLVSGHTHRLAREFFEFDSLGKAAVKGKKEPQEAYELLRAGEATTRIEVAQAKGLTRFVGRENPMASLMEAYERAESGSGQVVGILGEAGVGKSRLLLEFRNRLPRNAFTYLEGRCLHFGEAMTYLPILDILKSYFGVKERDQEFTIRKSMTDKVLKLDEKLESVLSPLQDLLALKIEDPAYLKLEPMQRRQRVFEAVRALLTRESQERPLVLAIEDLHWIDKTTEAFLDYFVGWLPNTRVLLLLLYRPEYTHPWESRSYFRRIGLNQLTLKSSVELVKAILEDAEVAPELRDFILERAVGNPFFMEELTSSLLENGSIQKTDTRYVLSRKLSEIDVPETIQGIIASRLDRLAENLKRIVQVASVIGREFAFRILEAIVDVQDDLKSSLLDLQGMEFIYEIHLFPELEYIFKHALTQEVAYNSLLVKRRRAIHERIGQAMERIYKDRLEEFYEMLAYHYARGESAEKACQYLTFCGDKAARNYSNWEAIQFYKEAIQVLEGQPETEERNRKKLKICLSFMTPMAMLSYPEGHLEILREAERLSKQLKDERSLATVYSRMGTYHTMTGNPLLGMEYSEKSFLESEKAGAIELMAAGAVDICAAHYNAGNCLKVVEISRRVLDTLHEHHRETDRFGRVYAVHSFLSALCGTTLGWLGDFEEGRAVLDRGRRYALDMDDQWGTGFLEMLYAWFSYNEGDGNATVEHSREAINHLEKAGPMFLGLAESVLAGGYFLLGEHAKARNHAQSGVTAQREAGVPTVLPLSYYCLALIQKASGDLLDAKNSAEEALKLSQQFHATSYEACAWLALGSTRGSADPEQIELAERDIRQGISMAEERKLKASSAQGYLFLGELFARAGKKEGALQNLKKAEAMYREMKVIPQSHWLARAREALGRL